MGYGAAGLVALGSGPPEASGLLSEARVGKEKLEFERRLGWPGLLQDDLFSPKVGTSS